MEDLAVRFADALERLVTRIRQLTVDRAEKAALIVSLALPALVFGVLALVFLVMTIHGALAIPLRPWGAYAVEAGVLVLGGALLWRKRIASETPGEPE
jgi:hypothetical protein